MPAVPKPPSKKKVEKKYSSLQTKKPLKPKVKTNKSSNLKSQTKEKSTNELKKKSLAHHNHKPTRKDRAEFPVTVVKELIEEAEGFCMCGCGRPDNETHHVMPRTRDGRGVKTNGLRVNTICNQRFHANEDELQYWIKVYEEKYGPYFWYDEMDWEEHRRKERQQKIKEQKEKELEDSYKPIIKFIENELGRKPTTEETWLLRKIANDKKDMNTLVGLFERINVS